MQIIIPGMSSTEKLLTDIETFMRRTGMNATTFGLLAAKNPALLIHLRAGGDVRLRTADKIRQFMVDHLASNKRQKKANQSSVAA